jgi:S-(hydroxymethyl)glutathione dehydrogenase / alcohol dehydrogenase
MKFLAAVLTELKAPLELAEIESQPLECGQVLVKLEASGICGAQLNEIDGVKGPDRFLPHLLGHEGGGVVVETGPGVTKVKPGDHVVLHWRTGSGIHAKPAKYRWGDRWVNSGWVTTFGQYSVASENRITPIDAAIPFEVAALMGCAVTTALGLINNLAKLKIGQSILVLGCGGVGQCVVQGAAMVSATPIIAIDIHDEKLEMAMRRGATHVINSRSVDWVERVQEIVGPMGVDVAVENTGLVQLIEIAYRMTAAQGRTILVGVPRHDQNISIHSLPLHHGKTLIGCEGGETDPTIDIPRYLKLFQLGKLELSSLITNRFPLREINSAIDMVRSGQAGRVIIQCGSEQA